MKAYVLDHYVPQVKVWTGKRAFVVAECKGYDANGCFSHRAAMRVAYAVKNSLQKDIDRGYPPVPTPPNVTSTLGDCITIALCSLVLTLTRSRR